MKTTEERAKESVRNYFNCDGTYSCSSINDCRFCKGVNTSYDCQECGADNYYEGYIICAEDQRRIDIENACDVYAEELTEIINTINLVGEQYHIDKLGEVLYFEGCMKDFRKKMESK